MQLDMIAETDARAKTPRPEQLVNLKIVEALDESGFIDGPYSGNPKVRSAFYTRTFGVARKGGLGHERRK